MRFPGSDPLGVRQHDQQASEPAGLFAELALDSQAVVARSVGLAPEGLANIEDNVDTVSNPSLTTLRLIATALKTIVAELVNPDYNETILASIQSILNEKAESVAARFRGLSDKDRRTLIRRFLVRLLHDIEEPWR